MNRKHAWHRTILAAVSVACFPLASPRQAAGDSPTPIDSSTVLSYAQPFLFNQQTDGGYYGSPRVQVHLKAEIAMALAAEVLSDGSLASSALEDLSWVIRNHLEADGGLNWIGPSEPWFFECHQNWFLIASEMVRRLVPRADSLKAYQCIVWKYLVQNNPAHKDFYLDNKVTYGPFFAYRCVDREGHFMTQVPMKASYEVGVALWAMAMMQQATGPDEISERGACIRITEYLDSSREQAGYPPQDLGFYDPDRGCWVRALNWNTPGWGGWQGPDWKYALEMEEGVLRCQLLTGHEGLNDAAASQASYLVSMIQEDGRIHTMPDAYGAEAYEYGEALAVLGMAARTFAETDPFLSAECLVGGQSVAHYVRMHFPPESSENGALLLRGMAQMYQAQQQNVAASSPGPEARKRPLLAVRPNPVTDRATLSYVLPMSATAVLRVFEVSGRQVAAVSLRASAGTRAEMPWEVRDRGGRPLSPGQYFLVLDLGGQRETQSLTVVR